MNRNRWLTVSSAALLLVACGRGPTAPAAPTIDALSAPNAGSLSALINASASGSISFTNAGGSDLTYDAVIEYTAGSGWLNIGAEDLQATVKAGESQIIEYSALCPAEPGQYAATVRVQPVSQNVTAESVSVVLNCTLPAEQDQQAPTVQDVTASQTAGTYTVTAQVNASDDVGVTRLVYYVEGQQSEQTLDVTGLAVPYTLDLGELPLGNHTLYVTAYDAAGKASAVLSETFTVVDVTPPSVNGVSFTQTPGTYDVQAAVDAVDNSGVSRLVYQVDGGTEVGVDVAGVAPFSLDLGALSAGSHTFTVTAYDAQQLASATYTATFTVEVVPTQDTTAPTNVNVTADPTLLSQAGNITLSATAVDDQAIGEVRFYRDGQLIGTVTAAPYAYTDTTFAAATAAQNGTYAYTVTAVDTAGNSTTSTAVSVQVEIPQDTTPPTVQSPLAVKNGKSSNATFTATIFDNVAVSEIRLQYTNAYGTPVDEDATAGLLGTDFSYVTRPVSVGTVITIVVKDASGNTTTASATVTLK